MWDECNSVVVWAFFGIAFLLDWNENWPFPVLWPLLSFPNLLAYWVQHCIVQSVQFSSVARSCPTLCDPMNLSTPGLPVHHQLPEFTQIHIQRVSDAIQPSHPLLSPFPPERLLNHAKTPGFLAPRGEEFNPGPETRLDHSELLCNKVLLKYKGDRESFWHRHQKGAEKVHPC